MEPFKNLADKRLNDGCVFCGGRPESRDHVPAKVFLDAPLPTNLAVVPACKECNCRYSVDEEYVACLIECVASGGLEGAWPLRKKIARILERKAHLRPRLSAALSVDQGRHAFAAEDARLLNVIAKTARGHAAYELAKWNLGQPTKLWWRPLSELSDAETEDFELDGSFDSNEVLGTIGELGSRLSQRLVVISVGLDGGDAGKAHGFLFNDWVDVQEGTYRYFVGESRTGVSVKIVFREHLACFTQWKY